MLSGRDNALTHRDWRQTSPSATDVLAGQDRRQNGDGICGFRQSLFDPKPGTDRRWVGLDASTRAVGPAVKRRFYFGSDP